MRFFPGVVSFCARFSFYGRFRKKCKWDRLNENAGAKANRSPLPRLSPSRTESLQLHKQTLAQPLDLVSTISECPCMACVFASLSHSVGRSDALMKGEHRQRQRDGFVPEPSVSRMEGSREIGIFLLALHTAALLYDQMPLALWRWRGLRWRTCWGYSMDRVWTESSFFFRSNAGLRPTLHASQQQTPCVNGRRSLRSLHNIWGMQRADRSRRGRLAAFESKNPMQRSALPRGDVFYAPYHALAPFPRCRVGQ